MWQKKKQLMTECFKAVNTWNLTVHFYTIITQPYNTRVQDYSMVRLQPKRNEAKKKPYLFTYNTFEVLSYSNYSQPFQEHALSKSLSLQG